MKKIFTLALTAIMSLGGVEMKAQNELVYGDVKVGDLIELSDGSKWYVGANEVTNGSFSEDPAKNDGNIVGWYRGDYQQMTTSTFLWFPTGGYDGGAYIQANKHSGAAGDGSIGQRWSLQPNTRYYFSFYLKKNSANNQYIPVVTLTDKESTAGGQNEKLSEGGKQLIGKNGEDVGEILGYGNFIEGEWAQTACSFESEEYTYLQFNARWLKENSIQACFDGVFLAKLYDPEETTQEMVAYLALQSKLDALNDAAENYSDYEAIAATLGDFSTEEEINGTPIGDLTEGNSLEDLQAAIDAIDAVLTKAESATANIMALNALLEGEVAELLDNTEYAGIDAFQAAVNATNKYTEEGYYPPQEDMPALEYTATALQNLKDAIETYRKSQPASEDEPADYTYLIDNPRFTAKGKWYIGSEGGDQRVKGDANDADGNTFSCWNAWRNSAGFTDNTIQQDLTNLPNGYYTVTADMNTQENCLTDQHVFATSSVATTVSPNLTETGAGWDPMLWETLTTAKVLVVDGNLKIGATSNGTSEKPVGFDDYRGGWFCVTNFKLSYLGEAPAEDVAAAIAGKFAEAEAMADTMHLAGDKATFVAAIAEAKAASDLKALNEAITVAQASEAEYAGVMNGSYKDLTDSIATSELYSDDAKALAQVPVDYMKQYLASAKATYKETGDITAVLRYYRDNLIPALQKAEAAREEVTTEEGKGAITATIESVKQNLAEYKSSTDYLAKQVAALNNAIKVAEATEVEVKDGADVTAYIANAACDNTDTKAVPAGWTVEMTGSGNGLYTNKGQAVDGNTDAHYLDAWNGTAGTLRYTAYQVLNVPNGKYTVKNLMRTSGTGVYLFASDKAPVKVDDVLSLNPGANTALSEAVVIPTNTTKYIDEEQTSEEGGDAFNNYTDSYGELWMEAADAYMAALNITGAQGSTSVYDLIRDITAGEAAEGLEAEWDILSANGGKGRGWFRNAVEFEVTDHVLVLGVTTNYQFLNHTEEEQFTGTWFSADNFQLILDKEGDNTGWNPATGVQDIETAVSAPATGRMYNLAGQQVDKSYKGIVIKNGKKYFVK